MVELDPVEKERVAQLLEMDPSDVDEVLCDFDGEECSQLDPFTDGEILGGIIKGGLSECQYYGRRQDGTPCPSCPVCSLRDYGYWEAIYSCPYPCRPHFCPVSM